MNWKGRVVEWRKTNKNMKAGVLNAPFAVLILLLYVMKGIMKIFLIGTAQNVKR